MSGGNGIIRLAQWNRENELAPLRYRGISFRSVDSFEIFATPPNPFTFSYNLTPQQAFRNITVRGSTANIFYPTVQSVLSVLNTLYSTAPGSEWVVSITNFTSDILVIDRIGPGYTFDPVIPIITFVQPNETRTLRFRVISPTEIYVY
jgi:hypothetical protein